MNTLNRYISDFRKLHVDRSHGIAPHKPVLLLTILQAFKSREIVENRVYLTAELVASFRENWDSLVRTNHDCRISYPFYYLKSDSFWKLVPRDGFENLDKLGSVVKSFSSLNAAVECAILDEDLYSIMRDETSNLVLQQFLLEEYFPATKVNLNFPGKLQYRMFEKIKAKILNEDSSTYQEEVLALLEQNDDEELFVRGSVFRREIPRIYNNTCCISGMRIDSKTSVSMIDACHIIPFSKSFDDTVRNGIALCPNLHRAFDRGLITLSEDYTVLISKDFKENDSGYGIKSFEGKSIILPENIKYLPLEKNLEWHRKNVFR